MGKRKHQAVTISEPLKDAPSNKKQKPVEVKGAVETTTSNASTATTETIQIVAGSYDRVLHGMTATIATKGNGKGKKLEVDFADTFLFSAHSSAIRCVAVSPVSAPIPGQTQKVFLASGATDERINVYDLCAHPPKKQDQDALSLVAPRPILENRKNRELGTLLHHTSTVTSLRFPTRSKLLSSSDDSTIAITRTRDWSMLSTIKAPIPKAFGRPSGDTAPFGGTPSGVNDFAIHPSMKLMISVSKGEKSMRLWNLMTGKKAGVLNFGRQLLQEVGEGKHSTGEGRRVIWGNFDGADEFAVGFERDIVVFGMDSVPKCRVMPTIKTKIHQFSYISLKEESGPTLLAVSTEDGRIMFFSTQSSHITAPTDEKKTLSTARLVATLGGKDRGVSGRIKEFQLLNSETNPNLMYAIAGSSDGKVRIWTVGVDELEAAGEKPGKDGKTIGRLVGTYETQNRITCMTAFLMIPRPDGAEESEDEDVDEDVEGEESSGDDE